MKADTRALLLGADDALGLQDLADRLASLVENPVTIESPEFELIAYSPQFGEIDEARKLTILQRHTPEATIRLLATTGVIGRLNLSNKPVRVSPDSGTLFGSRVAVAIRTNNHTRAYIWVLEANRPLDEEDIAVVQHAARVAGAEFLAVDQRREAQKHLVADFLRELMTKASLDDESVLRRAARLGLNLPVPYRLIVASPDDRQASTLDRGEGEFGWEEIQRNIASMLEAEAMRSGLPVLSIDHAESIVLLSGVPPAQKSRRLTDESMARTLRDAVLKRGYSLSVSTSGIYREFSHMRKALDEALRCVRVGRMLGLSNFAVTAGSLGALQLAPLLSDAYMDYADNSGMHETLSRLIEYDASNGKHPALVTTLEAFLDCACDSRKASERLSIHVNTLNYRLRRLVELTGFDFSSGTEILAIHLELKLRRLCEGRGQ